MKSSMFTRIKSSYYRSCFTSPRQFHCHGFFTFSPPIRVITYCCLSQRRASYTFSPYRAILASPHPLSQCFGSYEIGIRYICSNFSSTFSTYTNSNNEKETDQVSSTSWVDIYLHRKVQPFARLARLDKPIGTWLLAWPCMWSISLAANQGSLPDFKMMAMFGCGALLLRGAGCTINDLFDRDIDSKVLRTRLRPIARGDLTPFQGLCFLGSQLLLGSFILFQLNSFSQILGASSLILVFTYPLMKRITFWPQAVLGLTFNWGALLGYSAVHGNLDISVVLPLYIGGVFWTLIYDTIYAHQDMEDDLKVGVKSTALKFGNTSKKWLTGFGIACAGSFAVSGVNADIGWPYYLHLLGACGHLSWQIWAVDLSSRFDCNRIFVSNKWFGALLFSGILLGRLV